MELEKLSNKKNEFINCAHAKKFESYFTKYKLNFNIIIYFNHNFETATKHINFIKNQYFVIKNVFNC